MITDIKNPAEAIEELCAITKDMEDIIQRFQRVTDNLNMTDKDFLSFVDSMSDTRQQLKDCFGVAMYALSCKDLKYMKNIVEAVE